MSNTSQFPASVDNPGTVTSSQLMDSPNTAGLTHSQMLDLMSSAVAAVEGDLLAATVVTANTTAVAFGRYFANATSAALTITLPSAPHAGSPVGVVKTDSSANGVTVACPAGETFPDGTTSVTISSQDIGGVWIWDGTYWVPQQAQPGAYGPIFSLAAYGATTGATDNTAAVQSAVNAAAGNGRLWIPPGFFACTGQVMVPVGKPLKIIGPGKLTAILYYSGTTKQPFFVFPGQNHGSTVEGVTITGGANADPAVEILSNLGSGTNGYNSLITLIDSWLGYYYPPGGSAPNTYLANRGLVAQCDVLRLIGVDVWGRDIAVHLQQGTTDAYLLSSYCSVLPQGGETHKIGLNCENSGTLNFAGTLNAVATGFAGAGAGTTGALVRSVANLTDCYCESSDLPLDIETCTISLKGGHWGAQSTATNIFKANASSGRLEPNGITLGGITTPGAIFTASGSPSANAWVVRFPNKANIPGSVPANPLSIDQPHLIDFPGYLPFAQTITPASHAWQNNTGANVDVYVATAGSFTGTTTITYEGVSAITIPNLSVGDKITLPPWATLTWGVGGAVTTDPTFNGIAVNS